MRAISRNLPRIPKKEVREDGSGTIFFKLSDLRLPGGSLVCVLLALAGGGGGGGRGGGGERGRGRGRMNGRRRRK